MSYPYSQTNRLEEPHAYMYTPFQGEELLQSYQVSRMEVLHRLAAAEYGGAELDRIVITHALPVLEKLFDATSFEAGNKFRTLLGCGGSRVFEQSKVEGDSLETLAKGLIKLMMAESVTTLGLMHALIAAQLTNAQDVATKVWLDRLVQRFEVTKKLYESYLPGFRKGEGSNTSVRLYWLFALALCLFYARSHEIKCLSTLLKVCDLLCSLPENMLQEHIPMFGLSAVLATEVIGVQLLAEKKGTPLAAK